MPDPISNQVAQQAANQASQQQATSQPTEINISDQVRFEDAMSQNGHPEQQAQAVEAANGDVQSIEEPTLGDAILNGLEKMKTTHDARSARIEDQLMKATGEDMSVQDCMKVQFEVMQMGLEQELTGKIADKTSQGVQTLFKDQ